MHISKIGVTQRIPGNKNITGYSAKNISNSITGSMYDKISNLYYGKDIVSFCGINDFKKTLNKNYFKLPQGCYPDAFQIEAGKALNEGKDVLVEAPTGTGKTAIAHYAASKNMEEGKTTFYTTPLKALSNQKLNEFKAVYGEDNVGILTGDRRENVTAPIVIMTTEVYRNMALSNMYGKENPLMKNLGTVIFDEFHYLGDPDRGPVWEESVMFTPKGVQTLELSATIGNPQELKNWISDLDDKNISLISIPSEARHVPLEFDMLETSEYKAEDKRLKKKLTKGSVMNTEVNGFASKPVLSDFKMAVETLKQKDQLPAIFFVFSKKFSRELVDYLGREGQDLTNKKEKEEIQKIVDEYKSKKYIGSDIDINILKKGYAIHNAGIMPAQKELIEELFQKKLIKTVIATETLAAGINMPAKTVVISSPYKPTDTDSSEDEQKVRLLTSNEFKQMSGRAGRRGIDTVGYVYSMPVNKTTEQEFLVLEAIDSNPINSNYNPDYGFLTGVYEYSDESSLPEIFSKSFYAYSSDDREKKAKINELVDLSKKRIDVLNKRNFIKTEDGKTSLTVLGKMASKVRGYEAINLAELIDSGKLSSLSPEALAMIAGAIANPALPKEKDINNQTDITPVFDDAKANIDGLYKDLKDSVENKMIKLGFEDVDFEDYDELLRLAESIEKPDLLQDELKRKLQNLFAIRKKLYVITKTSGKLTPSELVNILRKGETVPTKILKDSLESVSEYKRKINAKDIDSYIEKLMSKAEDVTSGTKGNKAKAKAEKEQKEILKEVKLAQDMKYLDEKLLDAIGENYEFLKKYPIEKIQKEYSEAESLYEKLTSKDVVIDKIKGLISLSDNIDRNSLKLSETYYKTERDVQECLSEMEKINLDVFKTEMDCGIENSPQKYSLSAANIMYNWALLNRNSSSSMSNWYQLLREVSKEKTDEGSVYRKIMQTSDLLSQIEEMARAALEVSENKEKSREYTKLVMNAIKARKLLINYPIEI